MKPLNLIALLLFLVATALVLTQSETSVRKIQRGYYSVISPFVSSGSAMESQIRSFNDEVERSEALAVELEHCKTRLGELESTIKQLQTLEEENNNLRELLDFKKRLGFKAVAAKIVRRKPSTWWHTVTVNRGTSDSLADQHPVIASNGLVGKVDRAGKHESTILLLTDEKCQVSAKIEGSHEVGILSGQRTQHGADPILLLRYLAPHAKIKAGSKVFTTGRGGLFPPDILLGTVIQYRSGTFDAEALVRPAVDFENLQTVFVLTGLQP